MLRENLAKLNKLFLAVAQFLLLCLLAENSGALELVHFLLELAIFYILNKQLERQFLNPPAS